MAPGSARSAGYRVAPETGCDQRKKKSDGYPYLQNTLCIIPFSITKSIDPSNVFKTANLYESGFPPSYIINAIFVPSGDHLGQKILIDSPSKFTL
jgi:hypothetical protein